MLRFVPLVAFGLSVFFTPYFYDRRLTTGIFKNDFYIIWLAGCVCWIYFIFWGKFNFTRLGILGLISCFYIVLSILLRSFLDENSIYLLITFVCCIGIFCYLQYLIALGYFLVPALIILIGYLIQVFIGYLQVFQNDFRSLAIQGDLFNSGIFANYLAALLPMLLFVSIEKSRLTKVVRIVFFVVFLGSFILLILTFSRAAIIGTVLGCTFIILPSNTIARVKKKKSIILLLCLLIIPVLSWCIYLLKPDSALGRLTIYKVCLNIIRDYPICGIGANRFSAVYNNYQAQYFEKVPIVSVQLLANNILEAYNFMLQLLVEYGIIGLTLLSLIVYYLYKKFFLSGKNEYRSWIYRGSLACIISIVFASLFSNPFHVIPILIIFIYHLAIISGNSGWSNYRQLKRVSFVSISIILFCISVCYYSFVQYRAESKWYKAAQLAKYGSFSEAKRLYQGAYDFLKSNGDFLFNYGAEASLAQDYPTAIDILEQAKEYNSFSNVFVFLGDAYTATNQFSLAEKNYLHAIHIVPSRIYPKYQLIKMYKKWRKDSDAERWITHTLKYPVKIESEFVNQLLDELKMK